MARIVGSHVQIEPADPDLRDKNRREIQRNLAQPGFILPSVVLGVKHKTWWNVLGANPFTHRRPDRVTVARRLVELYEACVAEIQGSPGHASGIVDREKVLNQAVWKRILRRLSSHDGAWGGMREDLGKHDLSYGIAVWDRGRRKFLESERTLERMERATEHVYEKLWALVDEWLRLTTDGNPCLSRQIHENKTRGPDADSDDITSPLLHKITRDIEDSLAMENVQLARQVKALEAEKNLMRDEVEVVRQFNTELLTSRPHTQLNLPGRHRW
ncbi:hypothetical protein CMUS01_11442 [Colletotrichum musicola]|uniref:Uncharacterized protein n=1 Tax=Colletotrichum musicola TaxID=2175873 RepID=A0A8H6JY13_9PEZI|nr:hypothetical protein CMUS01_11442 [Colletotrichum musicola]